MALRKAIGQESRAVLSVAVHTGCHCRSIVTPMVINGQSRDWGICKKPRLPARRLVGEVKEEARRLIEVKPWLGPERLAWELRNVAQLQISPATVKRMKSSFRKI